MSKICVLGLGYIGLPTASILATHGHQVVGVDVNQALVRRLRNGEVHIQEPGLNTLVQAGLNSGKLKVAEQPEAADAFIIAVPTPISPDKRADLGYVESATRAILPHLQRGNTVILESTVPPGTTAGMFAALLAESGLDPWTDLKVAHSPERVLPGRILEELVSNDRVTGGLTPAGAQSASDIYASFVQGEIFMSDATTAEMVKLMENTYRDVNIALANEFARRAQDLGIDAIAAIKAANTHPFSHIHMPGVGVGGHCIPVYPHFLMDKETGGDMLQLPKLARQINDGMPEYAVQLLQQQIPDLAGKNILILGLAYRGDVKETAFSPTLKLINALKQRGANVLVHDPLYTREEIARYGADSVVFNNGHLRIDAAILQAYHKEYRHMDWTRLAGCRVVIDGRNVLNREQIEAHNLTYVGIGRS